MSLKIEVMLRMVKSSVFLRTHCLQYQYSVAKDIRFHWEEPIYCIFWSHVAIAWKHRSILLCGKQVCMVSAEEHFLLCLLSSYKKINSREEKGMRAERLRIIATLKVLFFSVVCCINIGTWVRLSQVYLQKLSNISVTTRIPDPWPAHRQDSSSRFHTYANPNLHTNLS
jgi:hypothetical protein